jgi:hypothetical protein
MNTHIPHTHTHTYTHIPTMTNTYLGRKADGELDGSTENRRERRNKRVVSWKRCCAVGGMWVDNSVTLTSAEECVRGERNEREREREKERREERERKTKRERKRERERKVLPFSLLGNLYICVFSCKTLQFGYDRRNTRSVHKGYTCQLTRSQIERNKRTTIDRER